MKKISLIMALVIFLSSVFTVSAYAAANENDKTAQINGVAFRYRVIDGKYAKITEGKNFIPAEIEGYPVKIIGSYSYSDGGYDPESTVYPPYSSTEKWAIPDTVTSIEKGAFYNNDYFNSIEIPSSVTHIGEEAFAHCNNLNEITIPDSISKISPYMFYECQHLRYVTLSDAVKEIGKYAFYNCDKLTKINFPKKLRYLREYAFYDCDVFFDYDFSKCTKIAKIEKECITKSRKYKKVYTKIISGPKDTKAREYAFENDIECVVAIDSKKEYSAGAFPAGSQATLLVDGEKLTDYSDVHSNKQIILTNDGKLTALHYGKTFAKVTLPNGKTFRFHLLVSDNPTLKKKVTSGKDKGTYKNVESVSVKKGKTVKLKLFGKAKSIDNEYTSTPKAKIVSDKTATTIKIKGKAQGTSTVKIKVNGIWKIKLKVKVN